MSGGMSRRRFIERSVMGGLAIGFKYAGDPLHPDVAVLAPEDGVHLQVSGDDQEGYGVTVMYRGEAIARHNSGGEFSAVFQNGERSQEDRIENWKASSWKGDAFRVTLEGICNLENLGATVFAEVQYDVIDRHVVRKILRLRQADMFLVFYQLSNRLQPVEVPAKFWSFDQPDCRGGALREYFPAAGFRTKNRLCVGLLTDSGYRNQWSRMVRRDGKPIKPAARKIQRPGKQFQR